MRTTLHAYRRFAAILSLAVITAAATRTRAADNDAEVERLRGDVRTLAADDFDGRGVGTAGLEKAAEYVRSAFTAAGLDVTVAGGDPYQEFEINTGAELTEPNTLTFNGPEGNSVPLKYDTDFRTCSFGAAGMFDADVVFCGYGIESTDPAYNDYDGVDVTGKVVVVIRRTPQQGKENGLFSVGHGTSRHAGLTTKVSQAFQRGAAALLVVNDVFTGATEHEQLEMQHKQAEAAIVAAAEKLVDTGADATRRPKPRARNDAAVGPRQIREMLAQEGDPLIAFGYGGTRAGKSLPVFSVSQAAVNRLLQASLGKTLAQLESEIDADGKPHSAVLTGWKATGQSSLKAVKVGVKNVIGVLPGEGPLANETVVIGAHYDHVGYGGEGSLAPGSTEVHNGADDNASGTAALMELARRFGESHKKLPRRLVFIAFTGEERGLLGSAEYVREPLFPLDTTIAMINMDMVGRMDSNKLTVFGTGTSPVWNPLLDKYSTELKLDLSRKPEGMGPSDSGRSTRRRFRAYLTGRTATTTADGRLGKLNYAGMTSVVDSDDDLVVAVATTLSGRRDGSAGAGVDGDGSRLYFGSIPISSADADGYPIQESRRGARPRKPD
ncbi:MAG: M20/M25/M40 family metallo-hydrolase [Planctomycetaceae bacterium]